MNGDPLNAANDVQREIEKIRNESPPPIEHIAHHEAGHLAAMLFKGIDVDYATIESSEYGWGHVKPNAVDIAIETQLFYLYCGEEAEARKTGNHLLVSLRQSAVDGDRPLMQRLTKKIEDMNGHDVRVAIEAKVQGAAHEFVNDYGALIDKLADALLEQKCLSGSGALAIFEMHARRDRTN